MSEEITVTNWELNKQLIYGILCFFLGLFFIIWALNSKYGFLFMFFGGIITIIGGIGLIILRIAKPELLKEQLLEKKKKKKNKGKKSDVKQFLLNCSNCGALFNDKKIKFCSKCGLKRKLNAFISYSTLDSKHFKIPNIAASLEGRPEINKAFYWTLDSGINIVQFMEEKFGISDVFILFCSAKALNSKSVEGEWQTAYELKKRESIEIISVYDDEKFIPPLLTAFLKVKFDKINSEAFINEIYSNILKK